MSCPPQGAQAPADTAKWAHCVRLWGETGEAQKTTTGEKKKEKRGQNQNPHVKLGLRTKPQPTQAAQSNDSSVHWPQACCP